MKILRNELWIAKKEAASDYYQGQCSYSVCYVVRAQTWDPVWQPVTEHITMAVIDQIDELYENT